MRLLPLLTIALMGCASTRVERIIKVSEAKVVKIGVVGKDTMGVCSGAFVTPTGIILTCAHCFGKDTKKVFIKTSSGMVFPAQPLLINKKADLALIAPMSYMGRFPYFRLGQVSEVGQQVISLGSPLGLQGTASVGYIANVVRKKYTIILHSAFINPGNSGGPLVDLKGRLIGVNEALLRYDLFSIAQGLYVAIDASTVRQFLE